MKLKILWLISLLCFLGFILAPSSQNGVDIISGKYADKKPGLLDIPYLYGIAEGQISDHTPWSKSGYVVTGSTTQITVWGGATEYVWPTGAMHMELVSSDNTNDKAGGAGALTVRIQYLTTGFVEKTEIVTLVGTTEVETVNDDIYRVNSFRVNSTGANGKAAGTISLRHLTNTPIYDQIALGQTAGRSAFFTVPVGKSLYVTSIAFSAGASSAGKFVRFTTHATYDNKTGTVLTNGVFFMPYSEVGLVDSGYSKLLEMPTKLPAGTDLKVSVQGESGTTCTTILRGWIEVN
jgi:hypothetical protein